MQSVHRTSRLLKLIVLGFAHWFFGNLYEGVVLGPNVLLAASKTQALALNRELFRIAAPYYYFMPWSAVTLVLLVIAWFRLRRSSVAVIQRWMHLALITGISAGVVTGFIILRYNLVLWLGDAAFSEVELTDKVWENFWVGNLRLLLVGVVFFSTYKTWITFEREHTKGAY